MVTNGFYFPGIEYYLPFFFSELSIYHDYIPVKSEIILLDKFLFSEDHINKTFNNNTNSIESDFIPYPLESLYISKNDFHNFINNKASKFLYTIEFQDENSNVYSIQHLAKSQLSVKTDIQKTRQQGKDISEILFDFHKRNKLRDTAIIYTCRTNTQAERLAYILNRLEPNMIIDTTTPLVDLISNNEI